MSRKSESAEIHEKVRKKYAGISCSIEGTTKYPTGRAGVALLGYDLSVIENVPDSVIESYCGVGNPFSLGAINPGETVLDIGCGGGLDLIYSGKKVGPTGRVYGIELVNEMVKKADANIRKMGASNCQAIQACSEAVPFSDSLFDVVISNGAIFLSPLKEATLREIYRVLKPYGRFQFADVILKNDLPGKIMSMFEGWSG